MRHAIFQIDLEIDRPLAIGTDSARRSSENSCAEAAPLCGFHRAARQDVVHLLTGVELEILPLRGASPASTFAFAGVRLTHIMRRLAICSMVISSTGCLRNHSSRNCQTPVESNKHLAAAQSTFPPIFMADAFSNAQP